MDYALLTAKNADENIYEKEYGIVPPCGTLGKFRRPRKDEAGRPKWESACAQRPHYTRREMHDMTLEEISDFLETVDLDSPAVTHRRFGPLA